MSGPIEQVLAALAGGGVRYVLVGGVAVVLHGHPRLTADVDVVLALDRDNVLAALRALGGLGYRPRAPVPAEQLADPEARRRWMKDKGLTVFTLWSPRLPATDVDVFVEEPFPFDELLARGRRVRLGAITVTVASVEDLIAMKRRAGRPIDAEDIAALERIRRLQPREDA